MRTPGLVCLALLVVGAGFLPAQDKGLSGKEWKVVKSEEAPPGTRVAFGADGKVTITYLIDGRPRELTGTYALAGTQLTLRLTHDGKERVETRTVKKLSDTVLVTEDRNRKLEELQRGP